MLLSDYLFRTQRLLTDANNRYWTQQELIIYINDARDRVVMDTTCTRTLPRIPLVQNQEAYSYTTVQTAAQQLTSGVRAIGTILNIAFNQTASLNPVLRRLPWSDFNRIFRSNPQNSFPIAWAQFDLATTFYVHPIIPGPNYTIEVDAVYLPNNLANPNDLETAIPDPVTNLVPLAAAYYATYQQQDTARGLAYLQNYELDKAAMLASMPPFSVLNRYM